MNQFTRQNIVSKLAQARIEAGISQQELARRIGTQKPNISRIENGQQNLSVDTIVKIAHALNKDVFFDLIERDETCYSLRLYDYELLTFSMEDAGLAGIKTKILSIANSIIMKNNHNV